MSRLKLVTIKKVDMIISLLSLVATCLYPPIYLYSRNVGNAALTDILAPIVLFLVVGVIVTGVCFLFTRNLVKSCIISTAFMIFFMYYVFLENIFNYIVPSFRYWHVMPTMLLIIGHISYFIYRRISELAALYIVKFMLAVFLILNLLNIGLAMPRILQKTQIVKAETLEYQAAIHHIEQIRPNVYYLMIDEYAPLYQMESYFGYDNSGFTTDLLEMGFNISYSSRNESYFTWRVMANIMQLEYIADLTTPMHERYSLRYNSKLFPLLLENGYNIIGLGSVQSYGISPAATRRIAKTEDGLTIYDLLLENTALYPFITRDLTEEAIAELEPFEILRSDVFPESNTFVFLRSNITHMPFLFKSDGSLLLANNVNWRSAQHYMEIYLGNYIYATTVLSETVEKIISNDPNAVIILQSDHGARGRLDNSELQDKLELGDKRRFFNAVYFGGEYMEIEGLSGVNTLRVVLNRVIGTNFSMLEVP